MLLSWIDSLAIVILVIFFIEILIARQIYRRRRKNNQLKSSSQSQLYVIFPHSNSQQGPIQTNTLNGRPITEPQHQGPQYILTPQPQSPVTTQWTRLAFLTCISSVFLITFLTISYLLRPFTNVWGLYLLPILVPLPFFAFPSLFQSRTLTTFGFLLCGLGFGFLLLLLL
jgi:hypothetical protein